VAKLRSRSCIIDGEAVACGDDGIALFDRIRYRHHDAEVFLYAFDLIELDGDDLRRDPLNVRKATLASVLARAAPGLRLNEHLEADGARMSSITPVCWALRALCQSAVIRSIVPVPRRTGSRARTRTRPR
jgi:bifunctional non-homologous end joining protein LigD